MTESENENDHLDLDHFDRVWSICQIVKDRLLDSRKK